MASYYSIWTTPCQIVCFQSPPSTMKKPSRHTTCLKFDVIKRQKSEDRPTTETALQGAFPFAFQDIVDGDLCQTECDISNPSGPLVEACEESNISKTKHVPTVDTEDMNTRAYNLLWVNSSKFYTSLSTEFSLTFCFFFGLVGLFAVLKAILSLITNLSLSYAFIFYFIFHINYLVFLLKLLVLIELRLR